jgi:hypothetical protein
MVAAGFNPAVDTKNLRLFVEANEVAISTNQSSGQFGVGDYIEFYGQGLDRPTTDSQIYYLIAGTTPGKRVRGDNQVDLLPDTPAMPPASSGQPAPPAGNAILRDPIFFSWVEYSLSVLRESLRIRNESEAGQRGARDDAATGITPNSNQETDSNLSENAVAPEVVPIAYGGKNPEQTAGADGRKKNVETATLSSAASIPIRSTPKTNNRDVIATLVAKPANAPTRQRRLRTNSASRKRKVKKPRHQPQRHERNHALLGSGFAPSNFAYTALRKDRSVYFVTVLNGDEENFFGQVITFNSSNPASQTINSPNPDLTSSVPARLEIALQGVNVVLHQVNIEFNGVVIGTFSFFGFDPAGGGHPVQVFNIPASQLHDGANTIRFILPAGGDVSIVDYVKLSYQHLFRVDTAAPCSTANRVADESLRFSIAGTQSVKVDGFCIPQVRLIDYTDPLDVIVTKPDAEPSASGYAITAPLSSPISKAPRLLYALRQDQFAQPAAISLNQPSTLNQGMLSQTATAGADFLVISNKSFIPNLTPLSNQRQAQGFTAAVVDVEDIYDEFGYGVHGPVAIKDFLSYAAAHWAVPPRYVILAGDGSFDPRNYFGLGNFDFVPTKLVDATFNETCSDDWLTDFDNDGIANIPVGRLPVRSAAEADLVVSKIVNFSPATVPQTALLVADDPTGYYFNFETANDQVQALLPTDMTVHRVNVRTEGAAQAKTDIISGFNQGRALVNYTGHGNVDVWTGAAIFTSADATALTNGNTKLSFVVVMDCLNGYFQDPILLSLSEALVKAPGGGAVATFASSGLTLPDGQHAMGQQLISLLYGSTPIALGDAIKIAKGATSDIDVRRTWIYFGDPSIKIR